MSRGIIYGVVGKKAKDQFLESFESLRLFCNYPIVLFTDQTFEFLDNVKIIKIPINLNPFEIRLGKINAIKDSKFEKTLYLDADTLILDDIKPIFDSLKSFDLALTISSKEKKYYEKDIPDYFPEYHTGVICYKKGNVKELFEDWLYFFKKITERNEFNYISDERGFRQAIYLNKKVRYLTLGNEWNFFIKNPQVVACKVKIIHGKGNLKEIGKKVNENYTDYRFFDKMI